MQSNLRDSAAIVALAATYFCAGKIGLSWAHMHVSVSAVWPPSGLALAALLLWGWRLWPGIFLGAFLVNITTQGTVLTALGIATGNTLEAVLAAWTLNRFAGGAKAFERARNIFRFVVLGPILSTIISATFGVTTLAITGFARPEQYSAIWLTWCLGDAVGELIFAPFIVIWMTQPYPQCKPMRVIEAAGLLVLLTLIGYFVFLQGDSSSPEYIVILPLLWAAFRFGQRGAVTSAMIISGIALVGTLYGVGPYADADPNESLTHLQSFMGTLAIAALVLASVLSERKRAEQRLELQESISRILADSPAMKEAAPRFLQMLCERAGWDLGAIWIMNRAATELQYIDVWQMPGIRAPEFESATRRGRVIRGAGLPGRVWNSGKAFWISDVTIDPDFRRASIANTEGLHGAFCFPIKLGEEVLGVVECFSREVREPDDHFLQMVSDIGAQVGQFIERKRAEDELLAQRSHLRAVVETAVDGIITIDESGTIHTTNPATERIFGYSAAEMVGQNVQMLIPPSNGSGHDSYIRNLLSTAETDTIGIGREVEGQRRDGTTFPLELEVSETLIGERRMFIGILRDITERKHAEETRSKLAAIVESSDDAIVSKDLDGVITSWNAGAERLFGYPADEMVGLSVFRIIPPEREEEERTILSRVRRGERIEQYETVRLERDGHRLDVSLTISPIRDAHGKIIGASKIARSIAARKRADDLLRQARDELVKVNEELERRVQERTADLEQANAALLRTIAAQKKLEEQLRQAQKMESIGTLAGGIAHDFNNILNIIRGYATLIGQQPKAAQQIRESLKIIDREIDRGASVVRQLLTVARKAETRLAPTNISDIVLTLNELIKTFPKNINVALNLDARLMPVLADRNQMSQTLLNICLNARDAMPMGGNLTIQTEKIDAAEMRERHVDAGPDTYVCVLISDTGIGMNEEVRARMFEPFFTTKGVGEGTGLGLAIVYGIVREHNGFIEVDSEPGRGTTFRLYLPVLQSEEAAVNNETSQPVVADSRTQRRGTVLLVEDEEPLVRLLQKLLPRQGYRVFAAMDGQQALDLYEQRRSEIDIVLLDLGLPRMTGMDVIPKLKEQNPEVSIVIATGYLEPELKMELLRAGVKDCIHKPYLLNEVLEKLDAILGNPRTSPPRPVTSAA